MDERRIYCVLESWSLDGEIGCASASFTTYEKAKRYYDTAISYDMTKGLSAQSFENNDVENLDDYYPNEECPDRSFAVTTVGEGQSETCMCSWEWYKTGYYPECHSQYKIESQLLDAEFAQEEEMEP